MNQKPTDDPILEAAVERALAPFLPLLAPELLDDMRKELRFGLTTHPRAREILDNLRARAVPQQSGPTLGSAAAEVRTGKGEAGGGR